MSKTQKKPAKKVNASKTKASKAAKPAKTSKTAKKTAPVKAKVAAKRTKKEAPQKEKKISAKGKAPIPAETGRKAASAPAKGKKEDKAAKKGKGKDEAEFDDSDDVDLFDDSEFAGSEEIPEFEEEVDEDDVSEVEVEETTIISVTTSADPEEIILTDAEGRRFCRVRDCDQISVVEGYCRYHYLLLWKKIQTRKAILAGGMLGRYVEELTARYPDKFLEMLRKDLRSEKEFLSAIQELEIDESSGENEFEDEAQSYIDEVRGLSTDSGTTTDEDEF
ncbi:MAG: hypothetical protein AB7O96_11050 [Pseudobdellovibrionaceae bacterium]